MWIEWIDINRIGRRENKIKWKFVNYYKKEKDCMHRCTIIITTYMTVDMLLMDTKIPYMGNF